MVVAVAVWEETVAAMARVVQTADSLHPDREARVEVAKEEVAAAAERARAKREVAVELVAVVQTAAVRAAVLQLARTPLPLPHRK